MTMMMVKVLVISVISTRITKIKMMMTRASAISVILTTFKVLLRLLMQIMAKLMMTLRTFKHSKKVLIMYRYLQSNHL